MTESIRDLIVAAAAPRTFTFTPAVLEAVRAVVRANARQPNRLKRVTLTRLLEHLTRVHKVTVSRTAFENAFKRTFGKSWGDV